MSGRGTIAVYAGIGKDPSAAASGVQEREKFTYRVRGGQLQVLDPSRKTVIDPASTRNVQQDVGSLSRLHVSVDTP